MNNSQTSIIVPVCEEKTQYNKFSSKQSGLETKVLTILEGMTPSQILNNVVDNYPKHKKHLDELNDFKNNYSKKGMLDKWWNKGEMQEKTNDAVFLLANMSDSQLKLQALLVWMTSELKKQQDIIALQQSKLTQQSSALEQNQETLRMQQEQLEIQTATLEEQGKHLAEQAEKLRRDNEELIQRAKDLKELREIGKEHDEAIDEHDNALNGMERFLLELKEVISDYHKDQSTLKEHGKNIDKLFQKDNKNSQDILTLISQTENLQDETNAQNCQLKDIYRNHNTLKQKQNDFFKSNEIKLAECMEKTNLNTEQCTYQQKYFIVLLTWLILLSLGLIGLAVSIWLR